MLSECEQITSSSLVSFHIAVCTRRHSTTDGLFLLCSYNHSNPPPLQTDVVHALIITTSRHRQCCLSTQQQQQQLSSSSWLSCGHEGGYVALTIARHLLLLYSDQSLPSAAINCVRRTFSRARAGEQTHKKSKSIRRHCLSSAYRSSSRRCARIETGCRGPNESCAKS